MLFLFLKDPRMIPIDKLTWGALWTPILDKKDVGNWGILRAQLDK